MITEASPILSLLFAKGLGTKTLSQLLRQLDEQDLSVAELVSFPATELVSRFGLRPSVAAAIQDAHDLADQVAAELAAQGIEILIRGIEPYPPHLVDVLGDDAPPVLFVRGDLSLLSKIGVGYCGSRKASEQGIRVASESARRLAQRSVNIVSGYAKGVDLAAHAAALSAGGVTTIVLAEGIVHFRAKPELRPFLDEHNYVVVSEFSPRAPWSVANAMQRNKTIIGLSSAVVCIESGLTGGTHAAAESTLALGLPLFVAEYAHPAISAAGNPHFLAKGAIPLRGQRDGTPNLQRLYEAIGLPTLNQQNGEAHEQQPESPTPIKEPMPEAPLAPATDSTNSGNKVTRYPKRLIEVDLPIARISAHARREKSIRHGHISTLHIWWARRPLAACRAVICAALWPDPGDPLCPPAFRTAAVAALTAFAQRVYAARVNQESHDLQATASPESLGRWESLADGSLTLDAAEEADWGLLRFCLLDFIADFANWDNSTVPAYLETSRALTQAAHEALGGAPGTRPLVVDPFAGGGSIPLEALRVGADAFASDLNPVAVLLNKVVLEYIPKYGQKLADEVRKWGQWVKEQAEQELAQFYPKDPDGATPIAYLWARTIRCEGPGCGVEVPLIKTPWLAKKPNRNVHLKISCENGRDVEVAICEGRIGASETGTINRGSVTCPSCSFTTPVDRVRQQLRARHGGTADGRMYAVVLNSDQNETIYRSPTQQELDAVQSSQERLNSHTTLLNGWSRLPDEETPTNESHRAVGSLWIYGMRRWQDIYTARQLLVLTTLCDALRKASTEGMPPHAGALLALCVSKLADYSSSLCLWRTARTCVAHAFGRQALPLVWDFGEMNPFAGSAGDWGEAVELIVKTVQEIAASTEFVGTADQADATSHPLPDDSAAAMITDPPYYDAVAYAELADYFYVWLKRSLPPECANLVSERLTPKSRQAVVLHPNSSTERLEYENRMALALRRGREYVRPEGIAVIVFAHKSTAGWESMLQAVIDGGWTITASWPIDTERSGRMNAVGTASLASSVHLVCRPREDANGDVQQSVGEWRDVLSELPKRIHDWMPRLAAEGVVGADAIFACLGPALEIFSRYSRVEKASGEAVPLREYLEHVWAAVSTEALSMIFRDADAAGLEPDARLTAMWLWTLGAGAGSTANGSGKKKKGTAEGAEVAEETGDDEEPAGKAVKLSGFTLEYDAARKIAQGLGISLEKSETIVEVKGDKARLLPVGERTKHLFGGDAQAQTGRTKRKPAKQKSFFEELGEAESGEAGWTVLKGPAAGSTVLDRLHQAMTLFAAGRGELMKRFLVEEGVGKDARFWKLAQSLSALYPPGTEEKRWVDGVLARKKGLGL